jgi:hypothetical protein
MAITGELAGETTANFTPPGIGQLGSDDSEVMGVSDKDISPELAVQPSKLPKGELFEVLKGWWRADSEHTFNWRQTAKEWFEFRSGEQWSAEDRQLLNAQQRPTIVFNRVLTVLKAIAGMEINGRHEVTFIPRNTQDTAINEVLTAASKWMADGCDAEDEESSAFEDTCTCGMGWTENRLDYETQWNGKYVEEKVSPFEMYWDRTAKKKNLSDSRRMARVRKMPLGDAMQLFPGFDAAALDAQWAVDNIYGATKTLEEKRRREENTTSSTYDDTREVTIVHMQWFEREYYWKIANTQNNTITELDDDKYKVFNERMQQLGGQQNYTAVKLPRRVFKQAFMGGSMLKSGDSPVKDQFIWKCITGELDLVHGTWFGLVKVMMDPQRWSNKWLSQVLHILNTAAKGGIIAEEDVPAGDPREFEDNYARPDVVTWVSKGAIAAGKIMPKPGGGVTDGHVSLMQYAITSIRDVTGINLDLLGQQDQNQPALLDQYRKQAGMTILATLFDSLRRFRKQVGLIRLYYIQNYLADGRLVRVVGPEGAQALPLLKDKCLGIFDAIVDDTPTSPNMKEANWAVIQPMLAVFKDQLVANPVVLTALLEYSPLPSRVIEMLKAFAANQKQDPEQQQLKQLNIAKIVAGINKDQSTAEMQDAKAGATQSTAIYDVAMARHLLAKGDMDGLTAHLEHLQKAADIAKTETETQHTRAKIAGQHADTRATHVGSIIDALTPIPADEGGGQNAIKQIASAMPPGARQAPDGHFYKPDPNRPGKYLRVVPRAA